MTIEKLIPTQTGTRKRYIGHTIVEEPAYWINSIEMMNKINEIIDALEIQKKALTREIEYRKAPF